MLGGHQSPTGIFNPRRSQRLAHANESRIWLWGELPMWIYLINRGCWHPPWISRSAYLKFFCAAGRHTFQRPRLHHKPSQHRAASHIFPTSAESEGMGRRRQNRFLNEQDGARNCGSRFRDVCIRANDRIWAHRSCQSSLLAELYPSSFISCYARSADLYQRHSRMASFSASRTVHQAPLPQVGYFALRGTFGSLSFFFHVYCLVFGGRFRFRGAAGRQFLPLIMNWIS